MNSGGIRKFYWKFSITNKGAVDRLGRFVNTKAQSHIQIGWSTYRDMLD